jgi:hypothetical protein
MSKYKVPSLLRNRNFILSLALALFSKQTPIPATVSVIFMIAYPSTQSTTALAVGKCSLLRMSPV